jgi:hypothetical protein
MPLFVGNVLSRQIQMPNQAPEPRRRQNYGGHGNNPATLVTIRADARPAPSASVAPAIAALWRDRHF